ncbi:hypothetical protein LIER_15782 [Lithospermum erythrorhizon]|uniref:Uncharacterized protein n=1 Tax=Lithospermum erythrorhizon TaxID=34254 RepID=A0AAV3Q634_LITER
MEPLQEMCMDANQMLNSDPLPFARNYQLDALEKALKENTIVFLDTGSGKTMIAIMLLRSYAHTIRKPSPSFAVFLVPTVVLVSQQAKAITMHTDLKVGMYWGEMGVDFWDAATWKKQQDDYEVLVMTPIILLNALRHRFLNLDDIKVMIYDECHNARGKHPYARLMTEFYHPAASKNSPLPRVFGMTASPIKSKGSKSEESYWKEIHELENLMNSKVYTCQSDTVLAEYITFATPKVKTYKTGAVPFAILENLERDLKKLKEEHMCSIDECDFPLSVVESARKRISRLHSDLLHCVDMLGIWAALKAAESIISETTSTSMWEQLDESSESAAKRFCLAAARVLSACLPPDALWSTRESKEAKLNAGYLTPKVFCLFDSLHEYRDSKDLRCIVFVERILTAIVLRTLLLDEFSKLYRWTTEHLAGHHPGMPLQSKKRQNKIVERFRQGTVNIIVATSILEEGLDVQSCNLVVRFDLPATICSFIQSRGRARMQNSDFIIMMASDDTSALKKVRKFLASGETMRKDVLSNASVPCEPLDLCKEVYYKVEATGAIVSLTSSIALLNFYCSRLPSDGYFKPRPRCVIDEVNGSCTMHLPKSCPIPRVIVQEDIKILKQLACLEACKQLHLVRALTDNLVPDILKDDDNEQEFGFDLKNSEHMLFLSPELIHYQSRDAETLYYYYMLELPETFYGDTPGFNFVLALRHKHNFDEEFVPLNLNNNGKELKISINYVGELTLNSEQVLICQKFQVALLRILLDRNIERLDKALAGFGKLGGFSRLDYLILPVVHSPKHNLTINWNSLRSVLRPYTCLGDKHVWCFCGMNDSHHVYTMSGWVCSCIMKNALVCTPHNGCIYYISGELHGLNSESSLEVQGGRETTYHEYYEKRHHIVLRLKGQTLLQGKHLNAMQNDLNKCRIQSCKGKRKSSVELPPELVRILLSPVSIDTISSFMHVPSVMHRIECLLLASNLKNMFLGHCPNHVIVPSVKVMEALTTKNCQESFHLESLETLGDSFLKYAVSQQLFKNHQNDHEGILSKRRERIICNKSLCKLGHERNIPGFIRDQPFDPKEWIVPGDNSEDYTLYEEILSPASKVYIRGKRTLKGKRIADVVEALIGVFFSEGGELLALSFMEWLGIKVDLVHVPYERVFSVRPERYLNVKYLEGFLKYSFNDPCLLLEALTHGSYMLPEIPRCYQRLEFIGDSVLDFLVTVHLYKKYPGLSPGMLTDLRSASVNNEGYAQSALKAELHKHLLHSSQELHRQLAITVSTFEQSSMNSTFGWDSEFTLPKVLGDVIESIAGAILVDSKYDTELVFRCMRPLLEPLVTPETVKLHPVRELNELCQKENYVIKKRRETGKFSVEVIANGVTYEHSSSVSDKKSAKKFACKWVLEKLKGEAERRKD